MNLSEIMTLNEAIEALKAGKKISRRLWNDNNYYQKITNPINEEFVALCNQHRVLAVVQFDKVRNFLCNDNNYRIIE